MNERTGKLKLDTVRADVAGPVRIFADRIQADIGAELESLTLVGSCLTGDFKVGRSDINTVLVVGKQSLNVLKKLAAMGVMTGSKKIGAPLLMTPAYIERSQDVFAIEFLDFQLIHHTVLGPDPFEPLTFEKRDVRLQCERELKATLIKMRQGYISSVNRKRFILDIVFAAVKSLVPYLRAMLWLKDEERPRESEAVFSRGADVFSVDKDVLIESRRWWYLKGRPSREEIESAFSKIYETVDSLAGIVDRLGV